MTGRPAARPGWSARPPSPAPSGSRTSISPRTRTCPRGPAPGETGPGAGSAPPPALVNELAGAADDRTLTKVIGRYGRIDLLCLDELGYIELDRRGAELLFQVFTEREEKASIAIASNAAFSEWTATFTDPRLCAAIVDRLTYDAHIITTGAGSYRLRTTTARRQSAGT